MIKLFQISSVENIMPKFNQEFTPISELTVLKGERASYQIAYAMDNSLEYHFELESSIKEHLNIYKIGCVPVTRAVHNLKAIEDDNYISTEGGIYPDILFPFKSDIIRAEYYFQGIWIEADDKVPSGEHKIKVKISNKTESASTVLKLEVLNMEIPPQKLEYGLPVHADCIASYYNMEVFSEEFWQMLEKFVKISAKYGSNMLVPPIFTPPLDTWVGGERLTVQLVEMFKDGDRYTFDFTKLERYIDICQKAGIQYFYMPPFFTQWGAEFTPKIIVHENGTEKRIFGWDVKSDDERYLTFLGQFIPELINCIKALNITDSVIFSLSDEPFDDVTIERYAKLRSFLRPLLQGFKTMDAFSNYKHFEESGTDIPMIPTDLAKDFVGKVPELTVYYCCAQDYRVSNRLIAMPLYRNRSFGYQLYKYDVKRFFHWALNFYNSQLSVRPINPFYETDADGGFPGGDTFSVYPGENGPIPSMRIIVFNEALQDLRVLRLLESYIGREKTVKLLEDNLGEITFENCARTVKNILDLRNCVIAKLKEVAE